MTLHAEQARNHYEKLVINNSKAEAKLK